MTCPRCWELYEAIAVMFETGRAWVCEWCNYEIYKQKRKITDAEQTDTTT